MEGEARREQGGTVIVEDRKLAPRLVAIIQHHIVLGQSKFARNDLAQLTERARRDLCLHLGGS